MFKNEQIIKKLISQRRYSEALETCKQNGIENSKVKNIINQRLSDGLDFLSKEKYKDAIDIFIELIGVVKPSIIISLLSEKKYHTLLIDYLIAIHKKGFSDSLHTRLLFSLFIQCNEMDKLSMFIEDVQAAYLKKRKKINDPQTNKFLQNFDSNAAIKVLQKHEMVNEAQLLIQAIGVSIDKNFRLVKEKKYVEAATHIFDHFDEPIGFKLVTKFGPLILKSDYNAGKIIEQTATLIWSNDKMKNDNDFIKLFWGFPNNCYIFLKSIIKQKPTPLFVNILISLLIPDQKATEESFFGNPKISNKEEAINLISDQKLNFDIDYIFSVCADTNFVLGTIYLLTRIGRINDSIFLLLKNELYHEFCKWLQTNQSIPQYGYVLILNHFLNPERITIALNDQVILSIFKKSIITCKPLYSEELFKSRVKNAITDLSILQECFPEKQLNNEISCIDFSHILCPRCHNHINQNESFEHFSCGHCYHKGCTLYNRTMHSYCPICNQNGITDYFLNDLLLKINNQ